MVTNILIPVSQGDPKEHPTTHAMGLKYCIFQWVHKGEIHFKLTLRILTIQTLYSIHLLSKLSVSGWVKNGMKTKAIDLNLWNLLHNLEFPNTYIVLTIQIIKNSIQLQIFILLDPNFPQTLITAIKYKNTCFKHHKTTCND